jgi:hypothetical protein
LVSQKDTPPGSKYGVRAAPCLKLASEIPVVEQFAMPVPQGHDTTGKMEAYSVVLLNLGGDFQAAGILIPIRQAPRPSSFRKITGHDPALNRVGGFVRKRTVSSELPITSRPCSHRFCLADRRRAVARPFLHRQPTMLGCVRDNPFGRVRIDGAREHDQTLCKS